MMSFEENIKRLADALCARDIMICKGEKLRYAENKAKAEEQSTRYPDLDVIPIINKHDKLDSYYDRNSKRTKQIHNHDLISGGTSLFEIVNIFQKRRFVFVLVNN